MSASFTTNVTNNSAPATPSTNFVESTTATKVPTTPSPMGKTMYQNASNIVLGWVVHDAIHQIITSVVCFVNTYPLDSDLFGG